MRKYYLDNRDALLEKRKKYYGEMKKDPIRYKKHLENQRKYDKKNRQTLNYYNRRWRKKRLLEIISSRDNRCEICGFDNVLGLQLHHKNGRKKGERKTKILTKSYPQDQIQVLCANCHLILHRGDGWSRRF